MCIRYLVQLLCGHYDYDYDFCPNAVPNINASASLPLGSRFPVAPAALLPCLDVVDDHTGVDSHAREVAYRCRDPTCQFEAKRRSWACCRCGSRPNTTGTCAGLEGMCNHDVCADLHSGQHHKYPRRGPPGQHNPKPPEVPSITPPPRLFAPPVAAAVPARPVAGRRRRQPTGTASGEEARQGRRRTRPTRRQG
ncbi:hypothetical protein PG994_003976 [Apiospora phragmitis]|uniref:Uncharacterized protein n=1 Tax=Apiospora phragmitis TaxID=2905665 RepID=A0ABR1VZM7_9PEZI